MEDRRTGQTYILLAVVVLVGGHVGCGVVDALQDPEEGDEVVEDEMTYCDRNECPSPQGLTATGDVDAVTLEWEAVAGAQAYRVERDGERVTTLAGSETDLRMDGLDAPALVDWGHVGVEWATDSEGRPTGFEVVLDELEESLEGERHEYAVMGLFGEDDDKGEPATVEGFTTDKITGFEVGLAGQEPVAMAYGGEERLSVEEDWSQGEATGELGIPEVSLVDKGTAVVVEDETTLAFDLEGVTVDMGVELEARAVASGERRGPVEVKTTHWPYLSFGVVFELGIEEDGFVGLIGSESSVGMSDTEMDWRLEFDPSTASDEGVVEGQGAEEVDLDHSRGTWVGKYRLDVSDLPGWDEDEAWVESAEASGKVQWPVLYVARNNGTAMMDGSLVGEPDWEDGELVYRKVYTDPDGRSVWLEDEDWSNPNGSNRIRVLDREGALVWESYVDEGEIVELDLRPDGTVVGMVLIDGGDEMSIWEWDGDGSGTEFQSLPLNMMTDDGCDEMWMTANPAGTVYFGCAVGRDLRIVYFEGDNDFEFDNIRFGGDVLGMWSPEEERLMMAFESDDDDDVLVKEWEWPPVDGGSLDDLVPEARGRIEGGGVEAMVQSGRHEVMYAQRENGQTSVYELELSGSDDLNDAELIVESNLVEVTMMEVDDQGWLYMGNEGSVEMWWEVRGASPIDMVFSAGPGAVFRDIAVTPGHHHMFGDDWEE